MAPADWPDVARIYAGGIDTGDATFETTVPPWSRWDADHLPQHRLVAELDDAVCGWAALSPVSDRCAYSGVAEVSVYVGSAVRGRGVGKALLTALLQSADAGDIWTVQAGIFPENTPSVRLHQHCGFRIVGTRERIGRLNGVWRDVLLLERRRP
jgi:phosphinothricin acetyltransferase